MSDLDELEDDNEEIDYKAGDMTVEEFKVLLRKAIEKAMQEALEKARTKQTQQAKPAQRKKERLGSTTYSAGAGAGITFKG